MLCARVSLLCREGVADDIALRRAVELQLFFGRRASAFVGVRGALGSKVVTANWMRGGESRGAGRQCSERGQGEGGCTRLGTSARVPSPEPKRHLQPLRPGIQRPSGGL